LGRGNWETNEAGASTPPTVRRNLPLSFSPPSPSPFCSSPLFNGDPAVSHRKKLGITDACGWVLEHFRHKHQLNVMPLQSPYFCSPLEDFRYAFFDAGGAFRRPWNEWGKRGKGKREGGVLLPHRFTDPGYTAPWIRRTVAWYAWLRHDLGQGEDMSCATSLLAQNDRQNWSLIGSRLACVNISSLSYH